MDEPKILSGLGQCGYSYPMADVSHLSEKDKKDLLRRGMRIPKELHSDEEFGQWVTVFSEWNTYSYSDGHNPTEEERRLDRMATASYECGLWYHRNRFNKGGKNICNHLLMSWWNTLPTTRNTTGNTCTNWNKPNFVT